MREWRLLLDVMIVAATVTFYRFRRRKDPVVSGLMLGFAYGLAAEVDLLYRGHDFNWSEAGMWMAILIPIGLLLSIGLRVVERMAGGD